MTVENHYPCPEDPKSSVILTAEQYVEQDFEVQDFLYQIASLCGESFATKRHEILEHLVAFCLENHQEFRVIVVQETAKAYLEYSNNNLAQAKLLAEEIVDLMPSNYRRNGKLWFLKWEVLFNSLADFIRKGSKSDTVSIFNESVSL